MTESGQLPFQQPDELTGRRAFVFTMAALGGGKRIAPRLLNLFSMLCLDGHHVIVAYDHKMDGDAAVQSAKSKGAITQSMPLQSTDYQAFAQSVQQIVPSLEPHQILCADYNEERLAALRARQFKTTITKIPSHDPTATADEKAKVQEKMDRSCTILSNTIRNHLIGRSHTRRLDSVSKRHAAQAEVTLLPVIDSPVVPDAPASVEQSPPEVDATKQRSKTRDMLACVVAIESQWLFGDGHSRNVNPRSIAFIDHVRQANNNTTKIMLLPDDRTDNGRAFGLGQAINADYIMRQSSDVPLDEFVNGMGHISLSTNDQIVYITDDADRAAALTTLKVNALHIGAIAPSHLVDATASDPGVRKSQKTLDAAETQVITLLEAYTPTDRIRKAKASGLRG